MRTLRTLIDETSWPIARLAPRAGISRATLYGLLEGRRPPTVPTIERLATALATHPRTGVADPAARERIRRRLLAAAGDDHGDAEEPAAPVTRTRYPGPAEQILRDLDRLPNQAEAERVGRILRELIDAISGTDPLARVN